MIPKGSLIMDLHGQEDVCLSKTATPDFLLIWKKIFAVYVIFSLSCVSWNAHVEAVCWNQSHGVYLFLLSTVSNRVVWVTLTKQKQLTNLKTNKQRSPTWLQNNFNCLMKRWRGPEFVMQCWKWKLELNHSCIVPIEGGWLQCFLYLLPWFTST